MAVVALPPPAPVPRRAYLLSALLALVLLAGVAANAPPTILLGGTAGALGVAATLSWLTRWRAMTSAIIACVLFIPIGRYGLPITLPFQMEPYRLVVFIVALCWLTSLLAEPETVRLPKTGIAGPVVGITVVLVVGVVANLSRITEHGLTSDVMFRFSFFAGYLLVMLILASVLRTRADLDGCVKVLVGGGAVVSALALVQNRTGYNLFDHLHSFCPILVFDPSGIPDNLEARGSGVRMYASAQHPLALGAALALLMPPAVYIGFRTNKRIWWLACALIVVAALVTVARTAVLMLAVESLVLLTLKPVILKRIWWAIPPFLVAVNIVAPATLGTIKASFFPQGGLVAQQSTNPGGDGGNRLSDTGPALHEASKTPFVGQGWGTRQPKRLDPNKTRKTLDDQWLGIVLEAGWFGAITWMWFFLRNIRLLAGASLRDPTAHGWLLAGLSASILGFVVGMFTFDAFGFPQATLLVFVMAGMGIAARQLGPVPEELQATERARAADDAQPAAPPPVTLLRRPAPQGH
jgi:Na+-transporting methylmalonyl-CoA/oxaloacetate decarboxylase gamma subunit